MSLQFMTPYTPRLDVTEAILCKAVTTHGEKLRSITQTTEPTEVLLVMRGRKLSSDTGGSTTIYTKALSCLLSSLSL